MASDVDFKCWSDFALVIVEQAIADYRAALKTYIRNPSDETAYVIKSF